MIGLLLKDLLVLRKAVRLYLLLLAFYLVLTVTDAFDTTMLTGFVTLFTMMLPITSFSYDELARWDKYAAALPVGRRGIVSAKYLLVLVLGVFSELLIGAASVALLVVKHLAPGEMLVAGLVCMGAGFLLNALVLPLLFRYGAEKARIFTMGIFAVIFLMGYGGARLLNGKSIMGLSPNPVLLSVLFIVGTACALFVSYRASLSVFSRKEL